MRYYVDIDTEIDEPHTAGPFSTRQEAEDYAATVNYDTEIREVQHDETQATHPRGWDKV
jgi:hypothetical protein